MMHRDNLHMIDDLQPEEIRDAIHLRSQERSSLEEKFILWNRRGQGAWKRIMAGACRQDLYDVADMLTSSRQDSWLVLPVDQRPDA